MWRFLSIAVVLWAGLSFAGRNTRAEADQVIEQALSGAMNPAQAVTRLGFLGQERWAASEFAAAARRAEGRQLVVIVELLAQLGVPDEHAVPVLLAQLGSPDIALRLPAIRGLGRMRLTAAAPKLEPLLSDKVLGVRRESARALGAMAARHAGPALMKAAQAEDDLETRALMLVAVGRVGDQAQARGLITQLEGSSELTRTAAAQALCLLNHPRGLDYARKQLQAPDAYARLAAVQLFEGAPAKAAAPVLQRALDDVDPKVRATAGRVLAQGGDASKVTWLVLESMKATGDARLAFETELEPLHLSDEERAAILKKAGLKP
jgi:HEAT repeat protein